MSMDAFASQHKRLIREIKELEKALGEARFALLSYADDDAEEAYLHAGGLRSEPHESIAPTLAVIDAALAYVDAGYDR